MYRHVSVILIRPYSDGKAELDTAARSAAVSAASAAVGGNGEECFARFRGDLRRISGELGKLTAALALPQPLAALRRWAREQASGNAVTVAGQSSQSVASVRNLTNEMEFRALMNKTASEGEAVERHWHVYQRRKARHNGA